MKRIGLMVVAGLMAAGGYAEMFGGTIAFKDGGTVEFVRLGGKYPLVYDVSGKLGAQSVRYRFEDLGQIIFSGGDDMIVVSKQGKRFALTDCKFHWGSPDRSSNVDGSIVQYRYLDPVTNLEQDGDEYYGKLAFITIGSKQGTVKKSPTTGEFFPSIYNFDPFTGEKLEWAKRTE